MDQNTSLGIDQWFPALTSLIGVLIGGSITLVSNVFVERKRSRHEFDKRAISEAYVPLCTSIEAFNRYYRNMKKHSELTDRKLLPLYNEDEFETLSEALRGASSAAIRWHFTTSDRNALDKVIAIIESMDNRIYQISNDAQKVADRTYPDGDEDSAEEPGFEVCSHCLAGSVLSGDIDSFSLLFETDSSLRNIVIKGQLFLEDSFVQLINAIQSLYSSLINSIDKMTGR